MTDDDTPIKSQPPNDGELSRFVQRLVGVGLGKPDRIATVDDYRTYLISKYGEHLA